MRSIFADLAPVPVDDGGLAPTYQTACELYRGDPHATARVGLCFTTRTALLWFALALAQRKNPLVNAVVASAAMQTYAIAWVWWNSSGRR